MDSTKRIPMPTKSVLKFLWIFFVVVRVQVNSSGPFPCGSIILNDTSTPACVYQNFAPIPPKLFPFLGCAGCYHYTMKTRLYKSLQFSRKFIGPFWIPELQWNKTHCLLANYSDEESVKRIASTFRYSEDVNLWLECCQAATNCCSRMARGELDPPHYSGEGWCPPVWDAWACWKSAPPFSAQKQVCPSFLFYGDPPSCNTYAVKRCNEGSWVQKSDFTGCDWTKLFIYRLKWHINVNYVSIVTGVPAIIILIGIKPLRNKRNIIHCHFLTALVLNSLVIILYTSLLQLPQLVPNTSGKETLVQKDGWECRLLVVLYKATPSVVYAWMLCEGLFLHHTIMAAFRQWQQLWPLYVLGWVGGVLPSLIWTFIILSKHIGNCWLLAPPSLQWITDGTRLLAFVINILLLADVVRVLLTKLSLDRSSKANHFRKTAKATFFLAPVFGLQFLLTVWRPQPKDCLAEEAYYLVAFFLDGLQGAIVALLYCFLNREVQMNIRRIIYRNLAKFWPDLLNRAPAVSSANTTATRASVNELSASTPSAISHEV